MDMRIRCRSVTLRDRCEADLEDILRWNTVQIWWKDWDAPWENTPPRPGENAAARDARIRKALRDRYERPLPELRTVLEVDGPGGVHLGWTNRYLIGPARDRLAIGIDLPDLACGGRGVATIAFALHAEFRFKTEGCPRLYTETWSGNLPMVGLAMRAGFVECEREVGRREVRQRSYDALCFVLTRERLWAKCPWLLEAELPLE